MDISYNPYFLVKDGKPWLPIMGEMQYSRTRREEWRDSLIKMKAGGVDIVQSYVFWIHHEEIEGEWNFEGNCELSAFLEEIKSLGMYMYLRSLEINRQLCQGWRFISFLCSICNLLQIQ